MLRLTLRIVAAVAVIGVSCVYCWYLQLKKDKRQHTIGVNTVPHE